jgi:hypothetical protein
VMLRWELRKMIRMMNTSCLLMNTENTWGKCSFASVATCLPFLLFTAGNCQKIRFTKTRKMHFCSLSKPRKLHGVGHNGLSREPPEYGILNYNEWINNVSRYLSFSLSLSLAPLSSSILNLFVAMRNSGINLNAFCDVAFLLKPVKLFA